MPMYYRDSRRKQDLPSPEMEAELARIQAETEAQWLMEKKQEEWNNILWIISVFVSIIVLVTIVIIVENKGYPKGLAWFSPLVFVIVQLIGRLPYSKFFRFLSKAV